MQDQEIITGLAEIIKNIRPTVDTSKVSRDTVLSTDLGLDSLCMLLVALAIETKFDFRFDDSTNFKTVGDATDYIKAKLAEKA